MTYSQGYKTAEYIDFQLAILKCLEQVGNGDDLKVIANIATSSRSYNSRVEAAAKACILYLQNRIIELNESQSLLRASSLSDVPDAGLLRPIHNVGDTKPEELLRPIEETSVIVGIKPVI